MSDALRINGQGKQLFQCLNVFGEGLAAGFGDAIEGLRLAQRELLFDSHVPGFFELEQLRAQLAVRGLGHFAKRLLGDGGNDPLSNVSARIELAYGWIGPETYWELHILRKIGTSLRTPISRRVSKKEKLRAYVPTCSLRKNCPQIPGFNLMARPVRVFRDQIDLAIRETQGVVPTPRNGCGSGNHNHTFESRHERVRRGEKLGRREY